MAPITYPLLINNNTHSTSATFPVSSPATGEVIHNFSSASKSDIDLALKAAQESFPTWKRLPPPKKRDIFLRAADLMSERTEDMKKAMVQETGAAEAWAEFNLSECILFIRIPQFHS